MALRRACRRLWVHPEAAITERRPMKRTSMGGLAVLVVVNEGVAGNLSTSTLKDDAYAVIFDQQGLMAGVSIAGAKISRIHP